MFKHSCIHIFILVFLFVAYPSFSLAEESTDKGSNKDTTTGNNDGTDVDAGDPISMATGEYYFDSRYLDLRGPTLPVAFDLHHGSQLQAAGIFGFLPAQFDSNHALVALKRLLFSDTVTQLTFRLGHGRIVAFELDNDSGDWILDGGERFKYSVEETSDYYYLKSLHEHLVYIFKKHPVVGKEEPAYCIQISDRNENTLTYTQATDPTLSGPVSVTDGLGRTISFTYAPASGATTDTRNYLSKLTDHTGRAVTFANVSVDGRVRLASITDTNGGVTTFGYDANHLIASKTLPAGNTPFTQTYETLEDFSGEKTLGRVLTQTDALDRVFTFEKADGTPGLGDDLSTWTNPDGTQARYFYTGSILSAIIDEAGYLMSFGGDPANDRFTTYTDRDGETGSITYHEPSGFVSLKTDTRGNSTAYTYAESAAQTFTNPEAAESVQCTFFDLTRIDYADRTNQQFIRNAAGNITSSTDRANETTVVTRNARGQNLTITNPENGVTTTTYNNATGLVATLTESDIGITGFNYDTLSRLTQITQPDNAVSSFTYDALDRLTSGTDAKGTITAYEYDKNSNITKLILAQGTPEQQVSKLVYNALDRLVKATDPAFAVTTFEYPYFNKLERITLSDGEVIEFNYDARRARISQTDEIGNVSLITRTPSELIATTTSREGRATVIERDSAGLPINMIDASGDTFKRELDVFSRIVSQTDGLGRIKTIVRDGEGRVTSRDEPRVGTTRYQYDGNGRMSKLTDARGNDWAFTHTPMGRSLDFTDPANRTLNRTYDTLGRPATITYPDAVVQTHAYNPDSTLKSRSYSDGLQHDFIYDVLNRITQITRSLELDTDTVDYTYDARSQIASTTVNGSQTTATYDSRKQLETATYPNALTKVTYTYDPRGLVRSITDSLTDSVVNFEYNADRQITKLTRSNGHVTTYTYDAEGLIASVDHDTGAAIDYAFNRADEPTRINSTGFPLDASATLTPSTQTLTFNDSSEITSNGHVYDDRGRPSTDSTRTYTWDSNGRLIRVVNDGTTIDYRYDAMGRITSRNENETTINYTYNAAIGNNPIIAEHQGDVYTRLYVATPSGQILYVIEDPEGTPAVSFYHFGNTGNTRFLTNALGTVTDSYAYDGFGRLLAQNGPSNQIYTFVGQLGVRQDSAAGLSHMRERYYDPDKRRFLSRDPIFESLLVRDGLNANPYHYVSGQPTRRVDPSGLDAFFDDLLFFTNDIFQEDNAQGTSGNGNGNADTDNGELFVFDPATGEFSPTSIQQSSNNIPENKEAPSNTNELANNSANGFNPNPNASGSSIPGLNNFLNLAEYYQEAYQNHLEIRLQGEADKRAKEKAEEIFNNALEPFNINSNELFNQNSNSPFNQNPNETGSGIPGVSDAINVFNFIFGKK